MKLKKQFFLFVIFMTIIPIFTVAMGSYYFKTKFYVEKEKNLLVNEVKNIKDLIFNFTYDTENLLNFLGKEVVQRKPEDFGKIMEGLIKEKKEFVLLYFAYENEDRSQIVSQNYSVDTKVEKMPFDVPEGFNMKMRPWYLGAKKTGSFYFSEAYTDANTQKNIVTFSLPVYKKNKLYGVLGLDIDLAEFSKRLNLEKKSGESILNIVDKNGITIISSKNSDLGIKNRYFKFFDKKSGEIELKDEGNVYLYEYVDFLNFYIFTQINKKNIIKEFEPLKQLALLVGVVSLMVSFVFSLLFIGLFEVFLRKLSESLYSIAEGNYENEFKEFENLIGNNREFLNIKKALEKMQENIFLREKTLEQLANLDTLTMIYNRRYLFKTLDKEYEKSEILGINFVVAILDLDNFKLINDNFGHQKGDEVLKQTVVEIQKNLRTKDILGRYGGEEFLIIFSDTNIEEALFVCERIRETVEKIKWIPENLKTTISIGVADSKNQSLEKILQEADYYLYEAKHKGKNRVESLKNSPKEIL